MAAAVAILVGLGVGIALITAAFTVLVMRFSKGGTNPITVGGLLAPLVICLCSIGVFFDQAVDGPPPGAILAGIYMFAAFVTPFTLLTSALTVRVCSPSNRGPGNLLPSREKVGA